MHRRQVLPTSLNVICSILSIQLAVQKHNGLIKLWVTLAKMQAIWQNNWSSMSRKLSKQP